MCRKPLRVSHSEDWWEEMLPRNQLIHKCYHSQRHFGLLSQTFLGIHCKGKQTKMISSMMHRDLWSVSHVPWLGKPDPKVFVGMMFWWDLWLETSVSQCSSLNTFHKHQSIRSGVGFSQADGHRASLLFPCMSLRKSCCWGWLSRPLVGRSDYGEFCSLTSRDTKMRSHITIGSQMSSGSTHGENKRDLIKNKKTEGMSFFWTKFSLFYSECKAHWGR